MSFKKNAEISDTISKAEEYLLHLLFSTSNNNPSLLHILFYSKGVRNTVKIIKESINNKYSKPDQVYLTQSALNYNTHIMYDPLSDPVNDDSSSIFDMYAFLDILNAIQNNNYNRISCGVPIVLLSLLNEIDNNSVLNILIKLFWSKINDKLSYLKSNNFVSHIVNTIHLCAEEMYTNLQLKQFFSQYIKTFMNKFTYKQYINQNIQDTDISQQEDFQPPDPKIIEDNFPKEEVSQTEEISIDKFVDVFSQNQIIDSLNMEELDDNEVKDDDNLFDKPKELVHVSENKSDSKLQFDYDERIWFQPNHQLSNNTDEIIMNNRKKSLKNFLTVWKELTSSLFYTIGFVSGVVQDYQKSDYFLYNKKNMFPLLLKQLDTLEIFELKPKCSKPIYLKPSYIIHISSNLLKFPIKQNTYLYFTENEKQQSSYYKHNFLYSKQKNVHINPVTHFTRTIYTESDPKVWNKHVKNLNLTPFYVDPLSVDLNFFTEYLSIYVFSPILATNNNYSPWTLDLTHLQQHASVTNMYINKFNIQLYFFIELIQYASKVYQAWLADICIKDVQRYISNDQFVWGILPARALDYPDQWVPIPSGFNASNKFGALIPSEVDVMEWHILQPNMQKITKYASDSIESKKDLPLEELVVSSLCMSPGVVGLYEAEKWNGKLCNAIKAFKQNHITAKEIANNHKFLCVCASIHSPLLFNITETEGNTQLVDTRVRVPNHENTGVNPVQTASVSATNNARNQWLHPTYENLTGPPPKWKNSALLRFGYIQDFSGLLPVPYPMYINANNTEKSYNRNVCWTEEELQLFLHRYFISCKEFRKIAAALWHSKLTETTSSHYVLSATISSDDYRIKTDRDCVDLYYTCKNLFQLKYFINSVRNTKSKSNNKLSNRQKIIEFIINKIRAGLKQLLYIKDKMNNTNYDIYYIILSSFPDICEKPDRNDVINLINLISTSFNYFISIFESCNITYESKEYTLQTLKGINAINTIKNILYKFNNYNRRSLTYAAHHNITHLENMVHGYFIPRNTRMLILPSNQYVSFSDNKNQLSTNLVFVDTNDYEILKTNKKTCQHKLSNTYTSILLKRLILLFTNQDPIGYPNLYFFDYTEPELPKTNETADNLYVKALTYLMYKTSSLYNVQNDSITTVLSDTDLEENSFPFSYPNSSMCVSLTRSLEEFEIIQDTDSKQNSDVNNIPDELIKRDKRTLTSLSSVETKTNKADALTKSFVNSFEPVQISKNNSNEFMYEYPKYEAIIDEDADDFDEDGFSESNFLSSLINSFESDTIDSSTEVDYDIMKRISIKCINNVNPLNDDEDKILSTILNYKPDHAVDNDTVTKPVTEEIDSPPVSFVTPTSDSKVKVDKKKESTKPPIEKKRRRTISLSRLQLAETNSNKQNPLTNDKSDDVSSMELVVAKKSPDTQNNKPSKKLSSENSESNKSIAASQTKQPFEGLPQCYMSNPSYIPSDLYNRLPHPPPYLWQDSTDQKYMMPMDPYSMYHFFPGYLYCMQPIFSNNNSTNTSSNINNNNKRKQKNTENQQQQENSSNENN